MDAFPFSTDEWQRVNDVSRKVVNASFMDDGVLGQSHLLELTSVLDELRKRHGEHPILLETEADFLQDATVRVAKYRLAIALAKQHNLSSYTVRLSLAYVLFEQLSDAAQAICELNVCEDEVGQLGDDWENKQWQELMAKCRMRQSFET